MHVGKHRLELGRDCPGFHASREAAMSLTLSQFARNVTVETAFNVLARARELAARFSKEM